MCPYHSWEFDADGINKCIPYCSSDYANSKRVNARKYETRERLGIVFVWYHAAEKPPDYELTVRLPSPCCPAQILALMCVLFLCRSRHMSVHTSIQILDEIEQEWFRHITTVPFDDWHMHIMEPSQNSADWYHFKTVHQWMCQDRHETFKFLQVEHQLDAEYGTNPKNPGTEMPPQLLLIQENISKMRLFGIIPLPSWACTIMDARVRVLGPQTILFCIDNWLLGKFRGIFTLTPEEPFLQKAKVSCWATWGWPWPLARVMLYLVMHTANQDRKVWEHKSHVSPRNLVSGVTAFPMPFMSFQAPSPHLTGFNCARTRAHAGDGPFAAYGKWLQQFYCPESEGFEDTAIDW